MDDDTCLRRASGVDSSVIRSRPPAAAAARAAAGWSIGLGSQDAGLLPRDSPVELSSSSSTSCDPPPPPSARRLRTASGGPRVRTVQ